MKEDRRQELQSIKLSELRQKRRQLEQKLRRVSNRLNFRRKKEEDELRQYVRSEERRRFLSDTHNFRKTTEQFREQLVLKSEFQARRKAQEVEYFRTAQGRRLQLVGQSLRDRKLIESEQMRRRKQAEASALTAMRETTLQQRREKHQEAQRARIRQASKRKYLLYEKKAAFQLQLAEETRLYEQQVNLYNSKIEQLKVSEEQLKKREEHAAEVLRCAQQNYLLLKQI